MATVYVPPGSVDCGGHLAATCGACPRGNGPTWCNGQCAWLGDAISGRCEISSPVGRSQGLHEAFASQGTDDTEQAIVNYVWLVMLSGIIMLIFACVYKNKVLRHYIQIPEHFHITARGLGLMACCSDSSTFSHTLCCMPVILGKNYYVARVMGFWPGCLISFFTLYTPLLPLGLCMRAIFAKKVQESIGHEVSLCGACFHSLCCLPCDVGRESMEVDQEVGAELTCCCKVEITSRLMTEVNDVKTRMCMDGMGKNRLCGP